MTPNDSTYIRLEYAPEMLNCSIKRLKYYIMQGHLYAYVRIPNVLPAPPHLRGISGSDEYLIHHTLGMYWEQEICDICQIQSPITWKNGQVAFQNIKVTDIAGKVPNPKGTNHEGSAGKLSPGGLFFWRTGWHFKEEDIMVDKEEGERFVAKNSPANTSVTKKTAVAESAKESTREIESLQKVLIAVAIDCYGYDSTAKKNTAVKDIQVALDKIGLSLSENTIRKHLKAGAQFMSRDENA